jgi:fermentation-respiration switch protein FrsA (DUF1100 family)
MKNTLLGGALALSICGEAFAGNVRTESVSFRIDGEHIAGTLYLPENGTGERLPAVVLTGSLTSVKEQMSGTYAREFAERGLIALAFDHRHYGRSGGALRQFESPAAKAEDLNAAVAYLQSRGDVHGDRIALVGVCTGGGNVLDAAAANPEIAAVVSIVGWLVEPSLTPALYGGEDRVRRLIEDSREIAASDTVEYVQTYGPTGSGAAHEGDFDYYMNPQRGAIPAWSNRLAVRSWDAWLNFDPVASAAEVKAPTLLIHSEAAALPDQARKVHARLPGDNKQLVWMPGGHFDFYDDPETISAAVDAATDFLRSRF